jgi:AraC-like DNA-binding protein
LEPRTSTVIYVRSLVPVVEAAGLPARRFLELLGIDGDLLTNIDARVPKDVVSHAWELAAQVTKHESLGMVASLHAPPGSFPVLDHIAANQPTVGDALASIARYCRLCDDELCMTFDLRADGAKVNLTFPKKEMRYSRHWAEWFVGLLVSRARSLSGDTRTSPTQVTFQHSAPQSAAELAALLGCMPEFDCDRTSVTFAPEVLEIRIQNASEFLSRIVLKHADTDLKQFAPSEPFTTATARMLREILAQGPPRIADLADKAHCSVRTVQMRLGKESTSYEDVLDGVRRSLALQYAADHNVRVMELSLLLRFADASSFYKAFKRWTGTTPLEYRRRLPGRQGKPPEATSPEP